MSDPSLLFCSIAEREYNATVATITLALGAPSFALRSLKANIKRYEQLVLLANDVILSEIEEIFLSLVDVRKIKGFSNLEEARLNFCKAAFSCRAARETMFPPNGNVDGSDDPVFVRMIPLVYRNSIRSLESGAFDTFQTYVCKLSLRLILDSFIDDYIDALEAKLDAILDALGINKIDEWIELYLQAIAPFLNSLNAFDIFAQCFFETCNFASTSLNKQSDIANKLNVVKNGPGWSVRIDEQMQSVYDKEIEMRTRISLLRSRIQSLPTTYKKEGAEKPVRPEDAAGNPPPK